MTLAAASVDVAALGLPVGLGALLFMDAGAPIPIPTDLLVLAMGERAAAGVFPAWIAAVGLEVVAIVSTAALFFLARGPAAAVVARFGPRVGLSAERVSWATSAFHKRGRPFLTLGRSTPGLRTLTVFAAATSGLASRHALPALVLGSTIFLQGHLFLGYLLGPLARTILTKAQVPLLAFFVALLVVGLVVWVLRRGRGHGGARAWTEAGCPACLAIGLVTAKAGD
jgi:membrane protein DedA with SNARE-associated domain